MSRNRSVTVVEVRVFQEVITKCEEQWGFKKVSTIKHFHDSENFKDFIVCGRLDDDEIRLFHVDRFLGVIEILED